MSEASISHHQPTIVDISRPKQLEVPTVCKPEMENWWPSRWCWLTDCVPTENNSNNITWLTIFSFSSSSSSQKELSVSDSKLIIFSAYLIHSQSGMFRYWLRRWVQPWTKARGDGIRFFVLRKWPRGSGEISEISRPTRRGKRSLRNRFWLEDLWATSGIGFKLIAIEFSEGLSVFFFLIVLERGLFLEGNFLWNQLDRRANDGQLKNLFT